MRLSVWVAKIEAHIGKVILFAAIKLSFRLRLLSGAPPNDLRIQQ